MVNWEEIRNQFPALKKFTYLNPASGSPLSRSAAEAGKRFFDEMLNEGDLPYEEWMHCTGQIRAKLAALINAAPSEIGFTINTSSGMNLISLMLDNPGEVLTMRDEFPSSTIPWLNQGYKVRFVEPVNYSYPVDVIEKQIGPGTRILVTSYVQYCTGFRQDLEAVSRLCKKHDLIFVVNATQAIGVMPLDVKQAGIDCMAFSGLKWATSGYGSGAVFISNEILKRYRLPFAGWQSTDLPDRMDNVDFQLRQEASATESGSPHFPSIFALGGALDLIQSIGVENIYLRILELNKLLQKRIEEIGLEVIAPVSDNYRSGILVVKTKNAKAVTRVLASKKIFVSARGEGIRVSFSFFNNKYDIENFIREAERIKELF